MTDLPTMVPNAPMTRRRAAALLAASIALAMSPGALAAATRDRTTRDDATELAAWIAGTLRDVDLATVAAAWRSAHPTVASRDAVVRAVLASRRAGESLASHLARRVAEEHAAGRAERLDGWYLVPTEARLALLATA
jgi:hypothetical protein